MRTKERINGQKPNSVRLCVIATYSPKMLIARIQFPKHIRCVFSRISQSQTNLSLFLEMFFTSSFSLIFSLSTRTRSFYPSIPPIYLSIYFFHSLFYSLFLLPFLNFHNNPKSKHRKSINCCHNIKLTNAKVVFRSPLIRPDDRWNRVEHSSISIGWRESHVEYFQVQAHSNRR